MTWKEFKHRIDKKLKKYDVPEDTEIWYIDCGGMLREDDEDSPSVSLDEDIGISISD